MRCALDYICLDDARMLFVDLGGSTCAGIHAGRLHVDHAVNLNERFESTRQVWIVDAAIGGDLNLDHAKLLGGSRDVRSLVLDGTRVDGRVYMRGEFRADCGVAARTTRVASSMYCDGGSFGGPLTLAGARIGGDLSLSDTALDGDSYSKDADYNDKQTYVHGLDLYRLRVEGSFEFLRADRTSDGEFSVNLAQGHVGYINDHVNSWRGAEKILDGFTFGGIRISVSGGERVNPGIAAWRHWGEYGRLLGWVRKRLESGEDENGQDESGEDENGEDESGEDESGEDDKRKVRDWLVKQDTSWVARRRRWLAAQPKGRWSAHPYDQIRAALQASGQETAARTIAIERERRRRKHGRLGWAGRGLNWLFGALLGHGYRPAFAVGWSFLIVTLGWAWFHGEIGNGTAHKPSKTTAPDFSSFGYALDAFLPFDLGQVSSHVMLHTDGNLALWVLTTAGWLLAALIAGAVTGLLRKD